MVQSVLERRLKRNRKAVIDPPSGNCGVFRRVTFQPQSVDALQFVSSWRGRINCEAPALPVLTVKDPPIG